MTAADNCDLDGNGARPSAVGAVGGGGGMAATVFMPQF